MTGPQGAGVFGGLLLNPDYTGPGGVHGPGISPIEYVYSWMGSAKTAVSFPSDFHYLPGDYVILAWWDYNNPTLTGIPSWMTPLENLGLLNPSVWGGFIPDFYALVQMGYGLSWGFQFTTNLTDQTRCMLAIGVYRNVSNTNVLHSWIRDRLNISPFDDTVDAVDVPENASSILLGVNSQQISTGFIFQSPAVERLSAELATNRAVRVFDQLLASGPTTYQTTNTDAFPSGGNDNNFFWNLAVNAGPDLYVPPYPAIGLVGTSTGQTLAGNTVTVTLPGSRIAGDLIMIAMHLDSNQGLPFADVTGWKALRAGSGARVITVFMKRDNGFETDPIFTAADSGTRKQYACAVYRGVGAVNWFQGSTGSTLTPTPTTTIDNTRAVAICVSDFYQPITLGTANGYTQRAVQNDASDGGVSLSDKVFNGENTTMDYPLHSAPNTSFMSQAFLTMIPGNGLPPTTPTVTVEQAESQADPTSVASIVFDVTFSEPVTGLTIADFTIGGTAGGTATLLESLGTGAHYRLTVTGIPSSGTVTASLSGSNAQSVNFGINNAASTSDDNTVTYVAPTPPSPVGWDAASGGNGSAMNFSAPHSGLAVQAGDILIVHWTGTTFSNTVPSAPAGWTTIVSHRTGSNNPTAIYGKIADGSETTATWGSSNSGFKWMGLIIRGGSSWTAGAVQGDSSSGTTKTPNTVVGTGASDLRLQMLTANLVSSLSKTGPSWTDAVPPQVANFHATGTMGVGACYSVGYGTSPSFSWTAGGAIFFGCGQIVIKP